MNNVIDRKSYYQTYYILKKIDLLDELPEDIRLFIINNAEKDEEFSFNQDVPLYEQVDNENTKALLSYLYIKYINKSETEKNMLLEKYKQNEVEHQNEKFSADNLLKKDDVSQEQKESAKEIEHTELVKYNKRNIFKRIIDRIKSFFRI